MRTLLKNRIPEKSGEKVGFLKKTEDVSISCVVVGLGLVLCSTEE